MVEVSFANHSPWNTRGTPGEFMQVGESDPRAGEARLQLTPEQAATRTWKPDAETWAKIKRLSVKSPATITISGFAEGEANCPVSSGKVTITTSVGSRGRPHFLPQCAADAVAHGEKGPITPLPPSALPLIKWELRDISRAREPQW